MWRKLTCIFILLSFITVKHTTLLASAKSSNIAIEHAAAPDATGQSDDTENKNTEVMDEAGLHHASLPYHYPEISRTIFATDTPQTCIIHISLPYPPPDCLS